ncbi:hypothetical protein [Edaphobacter flagellatus]|uniref:hypothetical protein n=1 Tax=Edaphobacter flagellatus TaxID=1933044 RepID=UPI0021B20408|nr:hypothetical protein [Edaphobacter flagellatus]
MTGRAHRAAAGTRNQRARPGSGVAARAPRARAPERVALCATQRRHSRSREPPATGA